MKWQIDKERISQVLRERSFVGPSSGAFIRFALVYPNSYFIGMSSLGYQVIYDLINSQEGLSCERFFYPPEGSLNSSPRKDLFSIERGTPLGNNDIIGFSLSFELDYIRVPQIISCGGLSPFSCDREDPFPLIIAGGAFSFYNPEPVSDFIDVVVSGEAEETLIAFIDVIKNFKISGSKDKSQLLKDLSRLPGIYIPSFYKPPVREMSFKKQWIKDLNRFKGSSSIITPDTEFSNMFLLEIARGCKGKCAFCMVGNCFKPYRIRNLDSLKNTLSLGKSLTSSVGLIAPNVSDYRDIDDLCLYILKEGMKLSFSSLRADSLTKIMVESLISSGQRTITLAPETGSDRLRKLCFKDTENETYFKAVEMSARMGIKNFRFYFMIGLPEETCSDLEDIIYFLSEIYKITPPLVKIYLSINQFIPKPGTEFERIPLKEMGEMKEKIDFLKNKLRNFNNLKFTFESLKWSLIQSFLSTGDRSISRIIFLVSKYKKENFQSWRKAFEEEGIDIDNYVYKPRVGLLPWSHITGEK
ncbi:MAG TPA: B12-binding domain-containing radical SAM protein [Candidatus Eremiobacteraeota bacterium]|nr:MAG: Radical SAM superfamily protein [bacterium ADurb.Bin363]HPZ09495.1 B12-binding domain-containing radical SAM protein [Candidatus Eremiobacteraeota bacterium]